MVILRTSLLALLLGMSAAAWAQSKPTSPAPKAPAARAASSAATTTASGNAIGTVDLLSGTVTVTSIQGVPRSTTPGMALQVGDTIQTEDESEVHATMTDGAYLAVRANSRLKITEYAANGNSRDSSLISLITGSLRTVTGWIAKTRPKAYRIVTPTATIGVRGTDHEVIFYTAQEAETPEEAGTHNVVYEGATTLETPKGSVNVTVGQAAYIPIDAFLPKVYTQQQMPIFLLRARGQYENDLVQHRNNQDSIMQRGLIERGLMSEGQNLQDIFKNIGGDGYIPGAGSRLTPQQNQQRQMQGVQNEINKNVFGGPGNVNEPLPVPFGIPGAGGRSGGSSGGVPSVPSGGGLPSLPTR
jgi:FecR protein